MADIDRRRLDELLEQTDQVFRDAYGQFVANVQSERVIEAISERLEQEDIEGALNIVRQHVVVMGQAVPKAISLAGEAAIAEFVDQLGRQAVAIAFDPTNPRAAQIIRAETLGLIRDFTDKQIEATRSALAEAFRDGSGTADAARAFRDSIGLTRTQLNAVNNYRRTLADGSKAALDYALRDRRFDRSVTAAIRDKRPLTPEQIDRMVDRYRQRYLAHRSETIARTESVRATSMAREESFRQMGEQTGVGDRMRRIWNATLDKRTRDAHRTMNGQTRRVGEAFQDGDGHRLLYPGDPSAPPETTINCRCVLTMRIVPAS